MTSKQTKTITYEQKITPTQGFYSNLYRDDVPYEKSLLAVLSAFVDPNLRDRELFERPEDIEFEEMTTPPSQLALFEMLITLSGGKSVLEIGTFIGRSTIEFARFVGPEGHVISIEAYSVFADMAQRNIERAGLSNQITVIQGDAAKVLPSLDEKFDFVFVDGSKQDYLQFALESIKLLSPNGILIVDDVFFHGDALNNEPTTAKGKGCRETLEYFQKETSCKRLVLPAWNGTLVLYDFKR